MSGGGLLLTGLVRAVGGLAVMGAVFMLPAGTWNYWQAWMVLLTMAVGLAVTGTLLWRHDRALLERRMHFREKEGTQKKAISAGGVFLLAAMVLPGLDARYGWSNTPAWLCVAADVVMFLSFLAVARVFMENTWASRVVEVAAGQQVVSTGPYAVVRHPMYSAVVVMYAVMPLALGSAWAVLPALGMVPVLVVRIRNEEEVLLRELPGYADYVEKVRWRLVPGAW